MIDSTLANAQGGKGLFVVIEGTDGSGKGTQFKLLKERLENEGHDVATFDFPQYDNESSYFVKQYLNGNYGSSDDVGPYTGSLFYALDRYQAASSMKQALSKGKVVLCNRFTGSNMAHQGTKFSHPEERKGYFIWLDNLEFEMLGIPRPTKNFVLRVPAEIAQQLVDKKEKRNYTDKKRDIHEADIKHLQTAVEVYDDLCELFPKDFERIDCVRDNQILDIKTIHKMMWEKVRPMLPAKKNESDEDEPYVIKTKAGYDITPKGEAFLGEAVTNTSEDVYAFTEKLSPITIAAAMARLSRRDDDMRITLLDEFAANLGKDKDLLKRVITAYGDDSVQQLVGQHMVVENASNLLTKKLEWGRLASYLEQSTRYIYYDQKRKDGTYRYHVPGHFTLKVKNQYTETLDYIFDIYSDIVHKLTDHVRTHSSVTENERDIAWKGATRAQACDAARPLLPVATVSTVGIYASGQALESLIMHLLADELPEARETGTKLLKEAREVVPTFLERADKPERGGATIAYRANTFTNVKKLSQEILQENYGSDTENNSVTLTSYWPRNELDLVADMLYEHSNLPLEVIQEKVAKLPYEERITIFSNYVGERLNRRHRPGRALEKAHYSWDLVCDYGIFRDLQRHRIVDDLAWQPLTPRFGFDVPELVEEANLTEQFEECFDKSLQLYSTLQAAGYEQEAQYATLLGHKMRWKVTYNAREAFHLHELRTTPQGHPGYRKLVKQMHDKLAEVHPLIADAMIFVNKDEDPELTRLAAERYTQFKLGNINKKT